VTRGEDRGRGRRERKKKEVARFKIQDE